MTVANLGLKMETNIFLKEVLSRDGLYCIFASNSKADKRIQKFHNSIDQLVEDALDLDEKGFDVYYALATFNESGSRKVNNVKHIKSFFLDLDCGPSKDFSSKGEALTALRMFCKVAKLPKPTLVDSGRGVHVYWALKEAVPVADWLPIATRLKNLCITHKFMADPAVTADAARVLRVPKTHNYKSDDPLPVEFIGESLPKRVDFDTFSELLGAEQIAPPKAVIAGANAMMHAALQNHEYLFDTIVEKSAKGEGCEQIHRALTQKNEISEPVWRGVISVLKACSDGSRERAHEISKGYDGYDPEETDDKWDRLTSDKRYTCSTFEEHNPEVCLACPHRGKQRSPLQLGKRIREATPKDNIVEAVSLNSVDLSVQTYVIPQYPFPYFRGAAGGVYRRLQRGDKGFNDEEPRDLRVYHNDLYVVKRVMDIEEGEKVVIRLHLAKDGVREFTIPLTAVTSKEELRKQMAMHGVAAHPVDQIMTYLISWVNELQAQEKADTSHRQFGWIDEEASGFALGNQVYFPDRVEFNPASKATIGLFPAFEPKGTLQGWKESLSFFNKPGFEMHQFVVCAAFGSIFMHFFEDIACSAIHIHSKDSGFGKTTAMRAGASIWGDHKQLVLDDEDTNNSKMNRAEIMHSLPVFLDELTNSKGDELSRLAYQFTAGKQRNRMSNGSNMERARGRPWSLITITTGNTSVIERISAIKDNPNAEAQRFLEIAAARLVTGYASKEETDEFGRSLSKHYGHAGPIFLKFVLANTDKVKILLDQVQKLVDQKAKLSSENRFWSAGIAVALTAGIVAKKLELIDFDMKAIQNFLFQVVELNKNRTIEMRVPIQQIISEYVNDHIDNILRIKSTADLRKADGTELDALIQPEALPRGKLVGRYETDLNILYLAPKNLRVWCTAQQINYSALVSDLKKELKATRTTMRLTKGISLRLDSQDVIRIPMKGAIVDAEGGEDV